MRAYSEDLRRKVVTAVHRGMPKAQAARLFDISLSSVKRYAKMASQGHTLAAKKRPGRVPKIDKSARRLREEDVRERPAATVKERRRFLEHLTGKTLSEPTLRRWLKRLGFSKKWAVRALKRDEFRRAAWMVMDADKVDPKRLVFVDEMGANTSLAPHYAYSPKGERAYVRVPRNRGPNTTLLSSMTLSGMGPSLAIEGATTAGVFEAYVERVLAPNPRPTQIVITDILSAHKTERVRELVEQRGCELLYLPPYSPDLNPIEEAFSKIKGLLRKAEARNRETLVEVMGQVLSAVSGQDACGFFEHAGYRRRLQGQLL